MKKFTALFLVLVLTLSLFGVAFAEEKQEMSQVQFEPKLTRIMEDGMGISSADEWLSSDMNVALIATLLPLDVITSDIEIDIGDYKAKDAYVGMNDEGTMTAVYKDGVSSFALILTYKPGLDVALLTFIDLDTTVTDFIMESAMESTCVLYKAVDDETAVQVAQVLLEALEGAQN